MRIKQITNILGGAKKLAVTFYINSYKCTQTSKIFLHKLQQSITFKQWRVKNHMSYNITKTNGLCACSLYLTQWHTTSLVQSITYQTVAYNKYTAKITELTKPVKLLMLLRPSDRIFRLSAKSQHQPLTVVLHRSFFLYSLYFQ